MRSRYSSATCAIDASSTASAAGSDAAVTGSRPSSASARMVTAWIRWTMLPLVSGSSRCSGSGCSAARSRWMPPSRNWYGHAAKRCSAVTEYGRRRQALGGERVTRAVGDLHQAVVLRPLRRGPRPTLGHGPPQRLVEPQQVLRAAAHRSPVLASSKPSQHRQVVLLVVDRVGSLRRRGPGQRRVSRPGGRGGQLLVIGNAAGDTAHRVERVERRHAHARLRHVEPRIREIQPLGGRTDRQMQQQTLAGALVGPGSGADRSSRRANRVGQKRILARLLREDPLGQAWDEHHAERPAPRLRRAAHEHPAVAPRRRVGLDSRSRSDRTARTSRSPTGPTVAIGRRSASTRST